MQNKQDVNEQLVVCIREHCPRLAAIANDNSSYGNDALAGYANHIFVMHERAVEAAGHSKEHIKIEEIERDIVALIGKVESLSAASREYINYTARQFEHEIRPTFVGLPIGPSATSNLGVLNARLDAMKSLQLSVSQLKRERTKAQKASSQRHYHAAAVAAACRKIWNEEIPGDPPKEVHPDVPGPMGEFITSVFNVLNIKSTPTGALRSLKKLGGEEQMIASITVG